MSRDGNHIAILNTVDGDRAAAEEQSRGEDELRMFSNTTFFDLDMGRSTDIATTVDELLMQQEKQIQYPHKSQPLDDGHSQPASGPVAGPSTALHPRVDGFVPDRSLPFDFSTLQGFSLAGELPQASLSIYDVDPVFHSANGPHSHAHDAHNHPQARSGSVAAPQSVPEHHQHQNNNHPHSQNQHELELEATRQLHRQPPIQRHELAELYAPKREPHPSSAEARDGIVQPQQPSQPQGRQQESAASHERRGSHASGAGTDGSGNVDEAKRIRNTAASARFRIKKKMREQEMERNQRVMQQKIQDQESRIRQLEMENEWLKNLVVEKNSARDLNSLGELRNLMLGKQQQEKA